MSLATASAWAAQPTVLRAHIDADIRSTDPGVNRDGGTDAVMLHIVEGLVGNDAKGRAKPLLAESIAVSEDGREYTFTLRDGIKFHNGQTLTADDVLWSWRRFTDPKTGWRCLSDFDGRIRTKVLEVKATDERTVVYTLEQADPLFLDSLARGDCGGTGIVHRDSLNADGSWNRPIGTGPFKFKEWRHREFVSLEKNADYVSRSDTPDGYVGSKRPLVDELRYIVITDPSTAKAALASGAIDVISKFPYSEISEFKDNKQIAVTVAPQLAPTTFPIQTQDKLLSNVKMRQAIAAALDYDQLVEGVTYGQAKPNPSIVPVSSPFYSDVHKQGYTHDLALAKKLLAEAGYKGERIVITTNKRNPVHFDGALIAQAMLQQAGINTDIEVVEWGTQQDRWQKGNYQLMSFSYSARTDASLSYEAIMGPKDTQPRKLWDNPEAQALLEKSMSTDDVAERQKLFDELHVMMLKDVPVLALFNTLSAGAYRTSVKGYSSTLFSNAIYWEVEKDAAAK
nr:ABC transporter substrate-binding protein [Verticiella sp. GG226]